jgi:membrane glycosyltransferase
MSSSSQAGILQQPRPATLRSRRWGFLGLAGGLAAAWVALAVSVLAPGGWSGWEVALLVCILANAPWLALSGATGLIGLFARLRAAPAAEVVAPVPVSLRTLLAVCVREEVMEDVLPSLGGLLDGLQAAGHGHAFAIAIMSDTQNPAVALREEEEVARFAAARPPGVVLYRRRAANTGYKAGNVMEFLDRYAEGFSLMLMLDADSVMEPDLVLRMVRIMQGQPKLAILQTTVLGRAAATPFAWLLGLGHRAGTLTWAAGQDWWQGNEGPYWGHNALLRITAFRACCRLDLLPDGSAILSHDHVEAARLHAAGWGVRVLITPQGSMESHPPNLAEYLDRDRRWSAGNMQYRHLLRTPDLSIPGRLQMLQALLHYALSPLWFAMLPLAVLNAVTDAEATPRAPLLLLLVSGYVLLHMPRLLGQVCAVIEAAPARRWRRAVEALADSAFLLLLDSILAFDKTLTVLSHAIGLSRSGWNPQQRHARAVSWPEAARRLWLHTAIGLLLLSTMALWGTAFAAWVALPVVAGLVGSVPFCVLTAVPGRVR